MNEPTKEEIQQGIEEAHCALLNFDNVTKLNPQLMQHPIYAMARRQLVGALKLLGRDPE